MLWLYFWRTYKTLPVQFNTRIIDFIAALWENSRHIYLLLSFNTISYVVWSTLQLDSLKFDLQFHILFQNFDSNDAVIISACNECLYITTFIAVVIRLQIASIASERNNSKRVNSFPMKEMTNSRSPLHSPERKQDSPVSLCFSVGLKLFWNWSEFKCESDTVLAYF